MIREVMRHEARTLAADRVLWLFLAVYGLMFAYAVVNGIRWVIYHRYTIETGAFVAQRRLHVLEQEVLAAESGERLSTDTFAVDPRSPSAIGGARGARFAGLEPGPLAALAIGQADLLPLYHDLSLNTTELRLNKNGELENPLHLMVGRFDVAFVLVSLMPLLILALSYNILSAEKEQGTLVLTLSQPVGLGTVLGGKVGARAVVVVGLALLLSSIAALATAGGGASPGRVALWGAVVLTYALFWFALAAAVNALGRGSAWNATVLVGAWLAFVVILPAVANIGASLMFPLPSRIEMVTAERAAIRATLDRRSELLAGYFEDHPEMASGIALDTTNLDARTWAASEEVYRIGQQVAARYKETLARQQALVAAFRFASPAILMQEALNDIAGTGDARYAAFRAQIDAFLAAWRARFIPRILAGERLSSEELRALPPFEYVEEPEADVFARVGMTLIALAGFTAVVTIAAWLWLRRYPVSA
jgi:ABC-2 type transport system permease protein